MDAIAQQLVDHVPNKPLCVIIACVVFTGTMPLKCNPLCMYCSLTRVFLYGELHVLLIQGYYCTVMAKIGNECMLFQETAHARLERTPVTDSP